MISFNMPVLIVGAFLLLNLIVGIYFSRKKTTFREHAVGNKQFSTATLVATMLATGYSASGLIRTVECVYDLGLYWIILGFLNCFGYWFISKLALRMGPFIKHLSMAETIGSVYGRYPRIVTALVNICICIICITGQIIAISKAISLCLVSTEPYIITIFSTLLVIFYSTFGGVRAIIYTDILQLITFSVIIPLLCWFVFVKVGNPVSEIVPILQTETKFQLRNLVHFNIQLLDMFLLLLSFLVSYIIPTTIQRVYMSSGPIQAQKVFSYATIFSFFVEFFMVLIALFVFSGEPNLQKEKIWDYIIDYIPDLFRGFLSIGLLSMAMSTADSALNACSVMISHDILKSIVQKEKEISDVHQLKMARWVTLVIGLLAMMIAFRFRDLLQLMYWALYCVVPIVTAPFILAVFGFRGTSRTALIGMVTGILSILSWNRSIQSETGIDGSFICMLANGLAMMAAHYLLKQPDGTGWVKPDNTFKQIQQENFRKRAERKETIKNFWANKKHTLSNLVPGHTTMVFVGVYTTISNLMAYFLGSIVNHNPWLIFQLFLSASFIGYPFLYDISKKIKSIARWFIGLFWIIFIALYMPSNLILYWYSIANPVFCLSFFLTHCTLILWVLPLYLGISIVSTTLLASVYPIITKLSFSELSYLFPLFVVSIILFVMTIIFKISQARYIIQNTYLKEQEKIRSSQQIKASLYEAALVPSNHAIAPKKYGSILNQVIRKVEESVSFLDNHTTLYKEDLQSIFNKFYDWVAYFNKREKAKDHALLQPDTITLDKLIRKVEVALSQEVLDPPKLLVEKIRFPNKEPCSEIVCDINQVVYSLVKSILRIGKSEASNVPIISIALHPTALQFKQADAIDHSCPLLMDFQAVALIMSQSTTANNDLPKVKSCYNEMDFIHPTVEQVRPPSIDIEEETISSMVRAHYGYLEAYFDQKVPIMLLVLPNDVTDIMRKMTARFPIDALTVESPVTPKEEADSMMELMQFYDHVSKLSCEVDPIDLKTVSGILLLLRKYFRFKRHDSGQLFYVRAVGIAKLVINWVFHSPKVVYAALLYSLVRCTCLPLSYIKEHYNLGVYAFVSNVVGIDKRKDLDHPSLLYVQNRLEQAIKEEHVQLSVLFIKLAERLYDLRHAAGYIHLSEVKHMAQETLTIDVQIAHRYLAKEIAQALEEAATQALEVCKLKEKEANK